MILNFKTFLKRLILVYIMIFSFQIIYSQSFLIGSGYVNNYNSKRLFSNKLNGLDFDLSYYFNKRFGISSSFILYKDIRTLDFNYKNWYLDLNSDFNFICKDNFDAYGFIGLGFFKQDYLRFNTQNNDYQTDKDFIYMDYHRFSLQLKLGLGSQYRIYKSLWIKLNIAANNNKDFITNIGLLYRFDFSK
jgi:hypothetical protein